MSTRARRSRKERIKFWRSDAGYNHLRSMHSIGNRRQRRKAGARLKRFYNQEMNYNNLDRRSWSKDDVNAYKSYERGVDRILKDKGLKSYVKENPYLASNANKGEAYNYKIGGAEYEVWGDPKKQTIDDSRSISRLQDGIQKGDSPFVTSRRYAKDDINIVNKRRKGLRRSTGEHVGMDQARQFGYGSSMVKHMRKDGRITYNVGKMSKHEKRVFKERLQAANKRYGTKFVRAQNGENSEIDFRFRNNEGLDAIGAKGFARPGFMETISKGLANRDGSFVNQIEDAGYKEWDDPNKALHTVSIYGLRAGSKRSKSYYGKKAPWIPKKGKKKGKIQYHKSNLKDFGNVIDHEIGHAFGMAHPDDYDRLIKTTKWVGRGKNRRKKVVWKNHNPLWDSKTSMMSYNKKRQWSNTDQKNAANILRGWGQKMPKKNKKTKKYQW